MVDVGHRGGLGSVAVEFSLRVDYKDGSTVSTTAETVDLVDYEEQFARSITHLDDELRYTDVLWLSWRSLTRQGLTALEWRDWLATVSNACLVEAQANPVPLEPEAASTST